MINILLCGGNGTRLWPISRKLYPKQFCHLISDCSLFQQTILRNAAICEKTIVVTNKEQYFLAKDQIEEMNVDASYILEPIGRNTAPAITLACLGLNDDNIVLVTPADHYIKNINFYKKVILEGQNLAKEGYMVTFGIRPEYPETGYGYIQAYGNDVISFKEKPDYITAKKYIKSGSYYWNSGMFLFKIRTYLNELEIHSPEVLKYCRLAYANSINEGRLIIKLEDMEQIPSISIDYAVMEKSSKIKVIPADISWSDLGNFEMLYDKNNKDEDGNVKSRNVVSANSHNNLIIGCDNRSICAVDIDDLIVVDSADALLISKKGSSAKVKDLHSDLERINENITRIHTTGYRPWGNYTILEHGDRYIIKRIVVKPGRILPLQKHYHRSEHWTVVNGTAKITINDREAIVKSNESIYIEIGDIHRLSNPGESDLVIIETQVGDYLSADDIEIFEGKYEL